MIFVKFILFGLFAIWGILCFVISLILVVIFYAIIFISIGSRADIVAHKLSRVWAKYIIITCGIRIKITGNTHHAKSKTFIFISNHKSMLDIPICALSTSHFFKFLSKAELVKIPLLGYIISKLYITVDRSTNKGKVLSFRKMEQALIVGKSIWIYPEGSRNQGEENLTEFQKGAFELAVRTNTSILACVIYDTSSHISKQKGFYLRPGTVKVKWLPAISPNGETATSLAKKLYDNMNDELDILKAY